MATGKVTSLADIVYEQVERDILRGTYQQGDVLTELKLCEKLQVSRTPVREALRRLEQDDLIESRGKSIVVVGIPPEDLLDILEIRERLEGAATARCCRHITKEQLAELDRQELVGVRENRFGFEALCRREIARRHPGLASERPDIEQIMLFFTRRPSA